MTTIQPHQIDTTEVFRNAFVLKTTNIAAYWVVRFCQHKGFWSVFTLTEIEEFCKTQGARFKLNGLGDRRWLIINGDKYTPTQLFIVTCHTIYPAKLQQDPAITAASELQEALKNLRLALNRFNVIATQLPAKPSVQDRIQSDRYLTTLAVCINSQVSCVRSCFTK